MVAIVVGFAVVVVVVTVVGLVVVVVVEVVVTVVGLAVVEVVKVVVIAEGLVVAVDLVEVVLAVVETAVVIVLSVLTVVTAGLSSTGSFCGVCVDGCATMATKNKTTAAVTAIHRLICPLANTFCIAASGIINTAAVMINRLVQ